MRHECRGLPPLDLTVSPSHAFPISDQGNDRRVFCRAFGDELPPLRHSPWLISVSPGIAGAPAAHAEGRSPTIPATPTAAKVAARTAAYDRPEVRCPRCAARRTSATAANSGPATFRVRAISGLCCAVMSDTAGLERPPARQRVSRGCLLTALRATRILGRAPQAAVDPTRR